MERLFEGFEILYHILEKKGRQYSRFCIREDIIQGNSVFIFYPDQTSSRILLSIKSANNVFSVEESYVIDTVQDVLIKLGIKSLMHLLEISSFSLNNDLVSLTKIMNNLVKDLKILSFKVIVQHLELVESFQKQNL